MAKIFVRERRGVIEGDARPRYAVVGVQGSDLKFFRPRVRRAEIEAIAEAVGAELVYLPRGEGEHGREGSEGRRRHRSRRGK